VKGDAGGVVVEGVVPPPSTMELSGCAVNALLLLKVPP